MKWVTKHLGHSLDVNQTFYTLLSTTIERAKVAKLLVLADQGQLGQFRGKSLQEIDFEGILCFAVILIVSIVLSLSIFVVY